MGRVNRKTTSERAPRGPRTPSPRLPEYPAPDFRGYRIPRVNRASRHDQPSVQMRSVVQVPRERARVPAHQRSRRYSQSYRRPRRESSHERRSENLRVRIDRSRSPADRFVHFELEGSNNSPPRASRYRSPSRNRRNVSRRPSIQQPEENRIPISARLGPISNPRPELIAERRITQILKFEHVPIDVDLISFLTLLSRSMRGINGATREYDYANNKVGSNIFIYAIDQDEVDAAVGRGFSFEFPSGVQVISPILLSATFVSVHYDKTRDPPQSYIPTLMLRNFVPVPARQAITIVIEAAQAVVQTDAVVTHVRVPGRDQSQRKTGSIAFVSITSADKLHELNGYELERCARKLPFNKSEQIPALVPTGLARRRPKDAEWTRNVLQGNMLIARGNPFHRA